MFFSNRVMAGVSTTETCLDFGLALADEAAAALEAYANGDNAAWYAFVRLHDAAQAYFDEVDQRFLLFGDIQPDTRLR